MRSKEYEKKLLSIVRRRKIRPNIKIVFNDEQGRTLYNEDYPEKLFKALQRGDTISDFCKSERIPRKKFYKWLRRYPEFKEAFDKGREAGKEVWRLRCLIPCINPETGKRYPNTSYHRLLAANIYGKDFLPPMVKLNREKFFVLDGYRIRLEAKYNNPFSLS